MKIDCDVEDVFEVANRKLQSPGLLLTSIGLDGRSNVMTIGWGLVGRLWRESVFMVAVRPSRHTFKLIEETDEFIVNVPADSMDKTVAYCGSVSGKEHDKFKERELTIMDGKRVKSPIIKDCIAHFECRVIGKSKIVPKLLSEDIQKRSYPSGDYSTLYFGRLLTILRDK